jgi:excisionase family DNA binding protein
MAKVDALPQMLSIETAAERLDVSHWTVRTWIRLGRLDAVKIGRRLLVREDAIAALLKK